MKIFIAFLVGVNIFITIFNNLKLKKIMGKVDEIKDLIANINAETNSIAADTENIAADIERISAGIKPGITEAEADEIIASLKGATGGMKTAAERLKEIAAITPEETTGGITEEDTTTEEGA